MPSNKENSPGRRTRKMSTTQNAGETDDDYRARRNKNNEAVKKSREKSKKTAAETQQRVDHLKRENLLLEARISYQKDRLKELKEVFLTHAKSESMKLDIDIDKLLRDDSDSENFSTATSSSTVTHL